MRILDDRKDVGSEYFGCTVVKKTNEMVCTCEKNE